MFRLRWEDSALDELAALWLGVDSSLRGEITHAAGQVDHRLLTDPLGQSESREEDMRILIESPIAVTFRVESDGQTVSVLHIWLTRTKPSK